MWVTWGWSRGGGPGGGGGGGGGGGCRFSRSWSSSSSSQLGSNALQLVDSQTTYTTSSASFKRICSCGPPPHVHQTSITWWIITGLPRISPHHSSTSVHANRRTYPSADVSTLISALTPTPGPYTGSAESPCMHSLHQDAIRPWSGAPANINTFRGFTTMTISSSDTATLYPCTIVEQHSIASRKPWNKRSFTSSLTALRCSEFTVTVPEEVGHIFCIHCTWLYALCLNRNNCMFYVPDCASLVPKSMAWEQR